MPDGPGLQGPDAAEAAALASDAALVRSVGRRLVAWAAGTTFLVLIVLAIALYVSVSSTLEASGVRQLDLRIDTLRGLVEGPGPGPRPGQDDLPTGYIFGGGSSGTFAIVLDADGDVLTPRDPDLPDGMPNAASLAAALESGRDVRVGTAAETPVRILTRPVQSRIGTVYVQVFQDRTAEQRTLQALLAVLLAGGAVVVLVAVGFGTVYSRRALGPIRDSLAAQRRALRRQREFAADASHELRTPLTVIRASVDHLRRHRDEPVARVGDALEDIGAEVDHLARLVDELLILARSDSGAVTLERLPVDLGDVAADAASSLAGPAAQRGVAVEVDPEPAVVTGDAARLRQLVLILVDNAVQHSPRDALVRVAVRREGVAAVLSVEDRGRGIRDEDLPRLFERFWRGPGAPPGGSGLGLAIGAWIVDGHGGRIEAANRDGGGARFTVRIPLAAGDGAG
ncbi:MAG TPA: HAMP domain-containing sensor histidine kinase [Candidatus Limnocylindrales bacterium]|nr:HAMP domain-containing sensor histidine kinase [Candidatus Limnocylindrales bacterium]